ENGKCAGFVGVLDEKIEMLFVEPQVFGRGIGKALLTFACEQQGARFVDVNEQNPSAIAFYEHMGFVHTGRSPLDGEGQPYPLLHMQRR
ncbi:GNAT family N-acetyltransferase, partial [Cronobacter sakazakii]